MTALPPPPPFPALHKESTRSKLAIGQPGGLFSMRFLFRRHTISGPIYLAQKLFHHVQELSQHPWSVIFPEFATRVWNGSERFGTVSERVQELARRGVARSEQFGTTSGQIDRLRSHVPATDKQPPGSPNLQIQANKKSMKWRLCWPFGFRACYGG